MTTLEDIEKAVAELPPDQLVRFRAWFEEFEAARFDQTIERDAKAGRLLTRYEAEFDKIRREAGLERDRLREETTRLEARIMAEARAETARILEAGKARIAGEVAALRKELERSKPELAAQIASFETQTISGSWSRPEPYWRSSPRTNS